MPVIHVAETLTSVASGYAEARAYKAETVTQVCFGACMRMCCDSCYQTYTCPDVECLTKPLLQVLITDQFL